MGENTKIEWCDHTFNPVRGCQHAGPGCLNCYAEAMAKRNPKVLGKWGPNGTRVVAAESQWKAVERWDRIWREMPERIVKPGSVPVEYMSVPKPAIFCESLGDIFEDWPGALLDSQERVLHVSPSGKWCPDGLGSPVGDAGWHPLTMSDVRARVFRLIDATRLTWLLLTKRPQNIRPMWPTVDKDSADISTLLANHMRAVHARIAAGGACNDPTSEHVAYASERDNMPCRDNVWLGTSIACQDDADKNIPELLKCRDLCRGVFLSIEPLIGPVDLTPWLYVGEDGGWEYVGSRSHMIDQVIVGGESGPNARPCNVAWIRSIVQQCDAAGVKCFVKQLGANVFDNDAVSRCSRPGLTQFVQVTEGCKVRLRDKKGADTAEWPEDLRVRNLIWKGGA